MVNVNPTLPVIALNVNKLCIWSKTNIGKMDLKKKSNFMLSIKDICLIQRTKSLKIKE